MAKLTFNIEKCKGCGLCVSACPKHLLIVSKSKINQKGHYVAELPIWNHASVALSVQLCALTV